MREDDDFRALFGDFANIGEDAVDAGQIGDPAILHRHIEIDAHENAFAGEHRSSSVGKGEEEFDRVIEVSP